MTKSQTPRTLRHFNATFRAMCALLTIGLIAACEQGFRHDIPDWVVILPIVSGTLCMIAVFFILHRAYDSE